MGKKVFPVVIVVFIVIVVVAGAAFMMTRRSHMMRPNPRISASGLAAVSADGNPVPAPAGQVAGKLPENAAVQEANGLLVALAINPFPPSAGKASNFEVTLTDASGQAISDAAIRLDLTMPAMRMPQNQLDLAAASGGVYRAAGYFTMRGWWRIEVIITRGGQQQSVFFDINL